MSIVRCCRARQLLPFFLLLSWRSLRRLRRCWKASPTIADPSDAFDVLPDRISIERVHLGMPWPAISKDDLKFRYFVSCVNVTEFLSFLLVLKKSFFGLISTWWTTFILNRTFPDEAVRNPYRLKIWNLKQKGNLKLIFEMAFYWQTVLLNVDYFKVAKLIQHFRLHVLSPGPCRTPTPASRSTTSPPTPESLRWNIAYKSFSI